jgi:hypothetical protein
MLSQVQGNSCQSASRVATDLWLAQRRPEQQREI